MNVKTSLSALALAAALSACGGSEDGDLSAAALAVDSQHPTALREQRHPATVCERDVAVGFFVRGRAGSGAGAP